MSAPAEIRTERLLLRKPRLADAASIFARYAADAEVCRYLAWPRHRSVADTEAFIGFSDAEWARWPAGPYLIFTLQDRELLGSTGLGFEERYRASTGYVLARDAWGKGFATEAVKAMRAAAASLGVSRLYACCHPDHRASRRVLEKAGFELEGTLRKHTEFPNLEPDVAMDVVCYACLPNG